MQECVQKRESRGDVPVVAIIKIKYHAHTQSRAFAFHLSVSNAGSSLTHRGILPKEAPGNASRTVLEGVTSSVFRAWLTPNYEGAPGASSAIFPRMSF